ncbi:MAG: NAD+ synthase [Anaerolineae bacterium]
MRLTVAQLNPVVGNVGGNVERVRQTLRDVHGDKPDLVVFPELFLSGYPPRDLLEYPWFLRQVEEGVEEVRCISREYPDTGIIVGAPLSTGQAVGAGIYNAALLFFRGDVLLRQAKSLLPTYDVFDEARYFDAGGDPRVCPFMGETLGVSICEDAWNDPELWPLQRMYPFDPIAIQAHKGATLFVNISASPFYVGKEEIRFRLIRGHAQKHGVPFVYVNQVGGDDELIFDGRSLALDRGGNPIWVGPAFEEAVYTLDTEAAGVPGGYAPLEPITAVYRALVLGIRDYLRKCGFSKAVVGLSGGIDSAVTCCLAAAALGKENVLGITMPSLYSSVGSVEDSRRLAHNLGIDFLVIPISPIFSSYLETLEGHFAGLPADVTEENIQARIRGNILMAFSNKFGYLVLSTGNKSELAVGYCTLYGDMSGGLSVISDVPKMMVYELARYINREREVIPPAILEKAPSAELRPNQRDEDSLPPYTILDPILHQYIEERRSAEEIIAQGFDPDTVHRVIQMVNRNEYKRRQAAPGLKVTTKAFGMGRRMPIAARY